MTRTITSSAPGSGTSISSSWKASRGSPKRSSRITQAAMVSGSVPGSTSSSDTLLTSTAIFVSNPPQSVQGGGRLPALGGGEAQRQRQSGEHGDRQRRPEVGHVAGAEVESDGDEEVH